MADKGFIIEWWSGKNLRTGQVGIFPRNYVDIVPNPSPTSYYGNEKGQAQASYYNPQNPQTPNPTNPYSSPVPPMAIANNQPEQQQQGAAEPGKPNKVGEMGKKFGKKLGNAAIFGAGKSIFFI